MIQLLSLSHICAISFLSRWLFLMLLYTMMIFRQPSCWFFLGRFLYFDYLFLASFVITSVDCRCFFIISLMLLIIHFAFFRDIRLFSLSHARIFFDFHAYFRLISRYFIRLRHCFRIAYFSSFSPPFLISLRFQLFPSLLMHSFFARRLRCCISSLKVCLFRLKFDIFQLRFSSSICCFFRDFAAIFFFFLALFFMIFLFAILLIFFWCLVVFVISIFLHLYDISLIISHALLSMLIFFLLLFSLLSLSWLLLRYFLFFRYFSISMIARFAASLIFLEMPSAVLSCRVWFWFSWDSFSLIFLLAILHFSLVDIFSAAISIYYADAIASPDFAFRISSLFRWWCYFISHYFFFFFFFFSFHSHIISWSRFAGLRFHFYFRFSDAACWRHMSFRLFHFFISLLITVLGIFSSFSLMRFD